MQDKILQCVECPDKFEFTVGEQKYYAEKKYNDPKRCPICRQNKKIRNEKNKNNDYFRGY